MLHTRIVDKHAEVQALIERCNQYEGLDLPLNLDAPDDPDGPPKHLLYYVDQTLVGYASITVWSELEVCGIVHPDVRRRGVGRALLDAARDVCRQHGASSFLLLCDTAGTSGAAFAEAVGGRYAFAEHSMQLNPAAIDRSRPQNAALQVRIAGIDDLETLAQIQSAAFGDDLEQTRRHVEHGLNLPERQYLLATLDSEPVGSLRLGRYLASADITAFGVLPQYQGRGLGRQVLLRAVDTLLGEDRRPIMLDVSIDNPRALELYTSCGFEQKRTYNYYTFDL